VMHRCSCRCCTGVIVAEHQGVGAAAHALCQRPGAPLDAVRERIRSAQYQVLRAVNRELVGLCWDIGRMIVEQQDETSRAHPKLAPVVREIGWSPKTRTNGARNRLERAALPPRWVGTFRLRKILHRCRDDPERELYLRMTRRPGRNPPPRRPRSRKSARE